MIPLSPVGKASLALEVARSYLTARRMMRDQDLPSVLRAVRRPLTSTSERPAIELEAAERLGRAVRRTLTTLPADSRCLMQSVVLVSMLARRGVNGSLVIGVRPGVEFGAHAWVELDGHPLLPPFEHDFARLTEL